jgi:hypothetical protein
MRADPSNESGRRNAKRGSIPRREPREQARQRALVRSDARCALRAEHEQGGVRLQSQQILEQRQAAGVAPLQIVEAEHERCERVALAWMKRCSASDGRD